MLYDFGRKMKLFKIGKNARINILMWHIVDKIKATFYLSFKYSYTLYFLKKVKEVNIKGPLHFSLLESYIMWFFVIILCKD